MHWHWFDALMSPIRQAQIPVLPALGNHDYFGPNAEARREIALRFPKLAEQSHYALPYGRLGLVWLDSNKGPLGDEAWGHQKDWFAKTLHDFDVKPEVKGVLVFLHHAPFTNSIIGQGRQDRRRRASGPRAYLQRRGEDGRHGDRARTRLRAFRERAQTLFRLRGRGRSARPLTNAPEENEPDDIFAKKAEKGMLRPFNYLMVRQTIAA